MFRVITTVLIVAGCLLSAAASAIPDFVSHTPSAAVYGEPAGTTMREEEVPREDEVVSLWVRIGYSFYYTDVAIYYTTDGTDPQGSYGSPTTPSTSVLRSASGGVTFIRNEPHTPANIDWWKAVLPPSTRAYGTTIKYKISAWDSGGGPEIFANNSGCADGVCNNPAAPAAVFSYPVLLAWPGKGFPNTNPAAGYPNIHLWKEEAVVGNNWMNVQLDQNGSIYDIYYPSAGCVNGISTKNEGYVDGNDTFPPGLPLGHRGQMHMNMGCVGLRVDNTTYWLTNEGGAYGGISQSYVTNTNVLHTGQTLTTGGNSIKVDQYDFCPKGITYPVSLGGAPLHGLYLKRVVLTNNGAAAKTINLYYFTDHALNGGDSYDTMSFDESHGAMIASDYTYRTTSSSGEYNPTSFPDYTKNASISLVSALKLCDSVGSPSGSPAADCWRDSSGDNDQGWIGLKLTLQSGESREVDLCIAGGYKQAAGDPGTPSIYQGQIVPALDWFLTSSAAQTQSATETYWTNWLVNGTTVDLPDNRLDSLFNRSLLATALHVDAQGGGVIAGMHNGAYPFVWPRDAVYAAVTLDRTGHSTEAENVYRFLRDVAYRAEEAPGRKGFWYQKYSTDGYMIWTAPQVDETAVAPWGVRYHYDTTGDSAFLSQNYQMVYEAARASSEDSTIDTRLYYDDAYKLMHSNNVWEDSWDDFLYSNAAVERGLRDAAFLSEKMNRGADAALFNSRADNIHSGILARLAWDGENTDISQLGLSYPFESLSPDDPAMQHIIARINGTAADCWGNNHRITNPSGEFNGLVNRYWGDNYWNGGPWFLSTLWYGQFYAMLQDHQGGKSSIDVLRDKLNLVADRVGPVGLGAEQIAPSSSLLYPGEISFRLQAAWPNAWESMSTIADAVMLFLDYRPDASNARFSIAPKLPSGWNSMEFRNIHLGASIFSVKCVESDIASAEEFMNITGGAIGFNSTVRIPTGRTPVSVTINGAPVPYGFNSSTGQVTVSGRLGSGAGDKTTVQVFFADAPSLTIQQLKSAPDGAAACLDDVVVTRVHADRFNVETADRSAGLAVIGTGPLRGDAVKLYGAAGTSGSERVLVLQSVLEQSRAGSVPGPVAMTGRSAGGILCGPSNIGLDVTLFGAMTKIAADGSCIVIDDGSGLASSVGPAGVRVVGDIDSGRFSPSQYVIATGSMSVEEVYGVRYPLLRVACPEDIW